MVLLFNYGFVVFYMIGISNIGQNIRTLQFIEDQQDYIFGIDGRSSLTSNDEETYGLKDSFDNMNQDILNYEEPNTDLGEGFRKNVEEEETFLVDYKNPEDIESDDNFELYDFETTPDIANTNENLNANTNMIDYTKGIRKEGSNNPNGKKINDGKKLIIRTKFKRIDKIRDSLYEEFNKLFSYGNIRNVSNSGINMDGKKYFNMVKICLEVLLENEDKLTAFLDVCSVTNISSSSENKDLSVDKEYEKLYFKTCFIFAYRKLFSSKKKMLQKINRIKLNKDCGCLYIHDVHKYFYKTLIYNLIGKNFNIGLLMANFKSILSPLENVYKGEEKLDEFQKHFIDVPYVNFSISYKYTDVSAVDYIFAVFYYSVINLRPFIYTLPKLAKEKQIN